MTMIHNAQGPSLVAQMEERFLVPLKRNAAFVSRTWFLVSVAFILFLHLALLAFLLRRDSENPVQVAQQQETPVEVIVEPPKPPPPPQKKPEPPKPQAKQEIEKPASSAPRAPNEEKVDSEAQQKETHAPKAPAPPKDGQPQPTQEAAAPADEPAQPDKTEEKAAKPDAPQKAAEALDKAKPEPKKKREAKVAKIKPALKTRHAKSALQQLAGASSLPDYAFARPTKTSPVYGGTEDSRYLAIVYGMIMNQRRAIEVPDANGNATIAFNVDDDGDVIGMGVMRTSGDPELDAEAMGAIRRASPFPPPPAGSPHGLVATIDFRDAAPTYTVDRRAR